MGYVPLNQGLEDQDSWKSTKKDYKKLLNEIDMVDILDYFMQHYSEFNLKEVDLDSLEKIVQVRGVPRLNAHGTTITGTKVLIGLLKAKGNLTKAAIDMNVRRDVLAKYLSSDELIIEGVKWVDDVVLDYVEAKLMEKIDAGDRSSINYYLNTQGVERGYGTYEQRRRMQKYFKGGHDIKKDDDFDLG